MVIPSYILDIGKKLSEAGFEAYLVGGSIRDLLLGKEPKDFDITTNALPVEIVQVFPKSISTNAKFGTIIVITADDNGISHEIDITTYRSEKDYIGGRWPSHVEFTTQILDDLKRRDFTINAIALDLTKVSNLEIQENIKNLLDPFHGIDDLNHKIIRAVGNPIERFEEDGLRPLRACRFASTLGFIVDAETLDTIPQTLQISKLVSMDRVREELRKIVEKSPKPSIGIELMRKTGLLALFIPELLEGYGMEQNEHHVHDVYRHLLDTMDIAPIEVRFAALFHDIGKPRTKQGEHFYKHDQVSAEMTREIMTRLKFPKKFIEETVNLVRWHMFFLPKVSNEDFGIEYEKSIRNAAFEKGWPDSAIRRFIRHVGGHEQIDNLIKLRIADALANPKSSFNPNQVQYLGARVAEIREQENMLSVSNLKINGYDLIEAGIPKGPVIKQVQNYLLEQVTDNIELNNKDTLLNLAKNYYERLKEGL